MSSGASGGFPVWIYQVIDPQIQVQENASEPDEKGYGLLWKVKYTRMKNLLRDVVQEGNVLETEYLML